MMHSDSFAQLAAALAAAQGEFPSIPKDRTVTVKSRRQREDGSRAEYTFSYAPLDTILSCVRPALSKNGLALVQAVIVAAGGAEMLRTTLLHSSGEWIANEIPIFTSGADNASQAYGSGLTYARRYSVTALLCLAADEDDDGNGAGDGDDVTKVMRQSGKAAAPATRPRDNASAVQEGEPGIFLGDSQKKVLRAKAENAGLKHEDGIEAALVNNYNRIDAKNVNAVLTDLTARARESADAGQPS